MKSRITQKVICKKCESNSVVKAGKVADNQRYKCKECGCQFQPNRTKGKLEKTKRLAVVLYLFGMSFRTIARLTKTDVHAVYRWIRDFGEKHYEKPEPISDAVIVELDEMWHYIKDKKTNVGYGKLIAAIPVNLSTGNVEGEIMLHLQNFTNGSKSGM
jgi:transposase-like protein